MTEPIDQPIRGLDDGSIYFVVVEMHGMGEQHVRIEHTEAVEMDDGPHAGAFGVRARIGVGRRQVVRDRGVAITSEFGRAHHQCIRHQVVTDERHRP